MDLLLGRRVITTSLLPENMQPQNFFGETLDHDTLVDDLNRALMEHQKNAYECHRLSEIHRGKQNILSRTRDSRVNNRVVINYAQAFTRDIVGYTYGKPIQYVPRKSRFSKEVDLLNDFLAAEEKFSLDCELANNQSIMGTAYRAIMPDVVSDEVPFELITLEPDRTFVAYSAYNRNRPVYGYTRCDIRQPGGGWEYVHQVYTNNTCYVYRNRTRYGVKREDFRTEQGHILGSIPIIEYPNNQWRLGDWECCIGLFDAINSLASDSINDVEQTVLSYLAIFGVEVEAAQKQGIQSGENRVLVFPGAPGVNQDAKFITAQLDGQSSQLLRSYLEEALRTVVGVPDRKTRGGGGGDTGDAVKLRDGWADLEVVARNKETFTSTAERRMLRIALNILSPQYVPEDMSVVDVDIKFSRNKTDNLQTKVQSFATLVGTKKIAPVDALSIVDITTDEAEIVKKGEEYWDRENEKARRQFQNQTIPPDNHQGEKKTETLSQTGDDKG